MTHSTDATRVTHVTSAAAPDRYRGRFAPSPTGPLHQGSLVSALASWLDARAHNGEWWVRIEDIDAPRCVSGAAQDILATLSDYGMHADAPVVWQSRRIGAYDAAFERLDREQRLYPCACSRRDIVDALQAHAQAHVRHSTLAYPGTCRAGLQGRAPRAWRLRMPDAIDADVAFVDRWFGPYRQNLASDVGDIALRRADGLWAYQLAVVVDDAEAGMTDIVRGADLLDSTPRQRYIQQLLGYPSPRYMHVPIVTGGLDGEKLSKQNGATPLPRAPLGRLRALREALSFLGMDSADIRQADSISALQLAGIAAWQARWVNPRA